MSEIRIQFSHLKQPDANILILGTGLLFFASFIVGIWLFPNSPGYMAMVVLPTFAPLWFFRKKFKWQTTAIISGDSIEFEGQSESQIVPYSNIAHWQITYPAGQKLKLTLNSGEKIYFFASQWNLFKEPNLHTVCETLESRIGDYQKRNNRPSTKKPPLIDTGLGKAWYTLIASAFLAPWLFHAWSVIKRSAQNPWGFTVLNLIICALIFLFIIERLWRLFTGRYKS